MVIVETRKYQGPPKRRSAIAITVPASEKVVETYKSGGRYVTQPGTSRAVLVPGDELKRLSYLPYISSSLFESEAWRTRDTGITQIPRSDVVAPVQPLWSREGGTGTVSELQQVSTPSGGIIPVGLPESEEEKQIDRRSDAAKARYEGREKSEEFVTSVQEKYQPDAQYFTQWRYNELMVQKAKDLGMYQQLGPSGPVWIYDTEEQRVEWEQYEPVARDQAINEGQEFFYRNVEKENIEQRVEDIYRDAYSKRGFVLEDRPDDTYTVVERSEYERQKRLAMFREDYYKKEYEGVVDRIGHSLELAGGFLAHPEYMLQSISERISGRSTREEESLALFNIEEAKREKGAWGVIEKMYGPGSLPFTVAASYVTAAGFGAALGAASQVSKTAVKGGQLVMGGYFGGRTAKEIETVVTKGQNIKWGGFLGLVPMGLEERPVPMTESERFASVGLMGIMVASGIAGYSKGLKVGKKFMSDLYQPKYFKESEIYHISEPIAETEFDTLYKGKYGMTSTRYRQMRILGKDRLIPGSKDILSIEADTYSSITKKNIKGITSKGESYYFPKDTTLFTIGKVKLSRTFLGLKLTKEFFSKDWAKSYPSRPMKMDVAKKTDVNIQKYVEKIDIGTLFRESPSMSLLLSKTDLSRDFFKPVKEFKLYPSESSKIVKEGIVSSSSITQTWDLLSDKSIMKRPRVEPIKVKWFQEGVYSPVLKETGPYGVFGMMFPGRPETDIWIKRPWRSEKLQKALVKEGWTPPKDHFGVSRIGTKSIDKTMREEIAHWLYLSTGMTHLELSAHTYKKLPVGKIKEWQKHPERITHEDFQKEIGLVSIPEMQKRHKTIFPLLNKAVKDYYTKGKLGASVQRGTALYNITPFRQIGVTKGPSGITYSKGYGISAVLFGIDYRTMQHLAGHDLKKLGVDRIEDIRFFDIVKIPFQRPKDPTVSFVKYNTEMLYVTRGNTKLGKEIMTMNLTPATKFCPSCGEGYCPVGSACYAKKYEARYKNSFASSVRMMKQWEMKDPDWLIEKIGKKIERARTPYSFLRFSVAGDIGRHGQADVDKMAKIGKAIQKETGIQSYTYTKYRGLDLSPFGRGPKAPVTLNVGSFTPPPTHQKYLAVPQAALEKKLISGLSPKERVCIPGIHECGLESCLTCMYAKGLTTYTPIRVGGKGRTYYKEWYEGLVKSKGLEDYAKRSEVLYDRIFDEKGLPLEEDKKLDGFLKHKKPQRTQRVVLKKGGFKTIGIPDVDFGELWGSSLWNDMLSGSASASVLLSRKGLKSKSKTEKIKIGKLESGVLEGFKEDDLLITSPISGLDTSQAQLQTQVQVQVQLQVQVQALMNVVMSVPKTVVGTPHMFFAMDQKPDKKLTVSENLLGGGAFDVLVKPRIYRSGKRISNRGYDVKLNKRPLSFDDAHSLGAWTIDNNEKASYRVVPVEGKPVKLLKKIPNYLNSISETYVNKRGDVVEKRRHRIDSPGEIRAITMKGIEARRKGKGSRSTGRVDRDFVRVDKMIDKTFKKVLKAGGF